jgi:gamma-glutamyltranspeptidase
VKFTTILLIVGYHFTNHDFEENTALTFHRIIESFQMGYAQRYKLGDPDYEKSVKEVS